jgi:hypothetical protein
VTLRATIAIAAALVAFGFTGSDCSTLPERAWCSNLTELAGRDCTYDTFEQCMASVAGLSSGNCTENPRSRASRPRVG